MCPNMFNHMDLGKALLILIGLAGLGLLSLFVVTLFIVRMFLLSIS